MKSAGLWRYEDSLAHKEAALRQKRTPLKKGDTRNVEWLATWTGGTISSAGI